MDLKTFFNRCTNSQISAVNLPAAIWQSIARQDTGAIPHSLRQIIIGGEAIDAQTASEWFSRRGRRPVLFNAYGPTEATVCCILESLQEQP